MAESVREYKVFVSSPTDAGKQRRVIRDTINGLSVTYKRRGIILSPWLWEEDSSSEFGQSPQELINRQLGDYDIYIGVMGARFGSPTSKYGSGTEQEFSEAFEMYKRSGMPDIAFYFKIEQLPSNLSRESIEQLSKVAEFKEKIGPLGLYREFLEDHQLSVEVTKFLSLCVEKRHFDTAPVPHQYSIPTEEVIRSPRISKLFYQEFLNATGEDLSGGQDVITLDQIWVEPDLTLVTEDQVKKGVVGDKFSIEALCSKFDTGLNYLITGGETCGKTSICKKIFARSFENGFFPVIIDGHRLNSPDPIRFQNRLRTAYAEQYENIESAFSMSDFQKRQVIILDDFDLSRMNAANTDKLLTVISQNYRSVILTAGPSFQYGLIDRARSNPMPVSLSRVDVADFGKVKRYTLVSRWCSLDSSNRDDEALRAEIEEKRRTVDRMLASNLVPRTPLVVLILLKAIQLGQAGDLANAGYVRYYKFLIDSAILKNISRQEAEGAYALLPEIAWAMYRSPAQELTPQQVEHVIDEFAQRRALRKTSLYSILGSLRTISMFETSGEAYKFKFVYTFYFFLGDFISKNLHKSYMQDEVKRLCSSVLKKENADILVFLSFHTDSPIIAQTLIEGASTLYPNAAPFDLNTSRNAAINKLIYEMPKLVVDRTKSEDRRVGHLSAEEAMEASPQAQNSLVEESPLSLITTTMRAVEILGHIVRNHYTRLDAGPKREIIEAATSVTLRSLGHMFDQLSSSVDAVVTAVRMFTDKFDKEADEDKKRDIANNVVFLLAAGLVVYFTKSLARAIGDENLEISYHDVFSKAPESVRQYLNVVVKLDNFKQFPIKDVKSLTEKIGNNQLGMLCLRCAVIERLDMRPPSKAADLQKFCDAVGIEVLPRLVARSSKS